MLDSSRVVESKWQSGYPVVELTYPSEPFTELKHGSKLAVGRRMPGTVDLMQRRGNRMKAVLPVRLKGKDSAGKAFDELVHTLDVTASGARLGSVRRELNVDDEVIVFYRQRKMQFRVAWTKKMNGTSEFQVGLRALTQDREAWGMALPAQNAESKRPALSRAPVVA